MGPLKTCFTNMANLSSDTARICVTNHISNIHQPLTCTRDLVEPRSHRFKIQNVLWRLSMWARSRLMSARRERFRATSSFHSFPWCSPPFKPFPFRVFLFVCLPPLISLFSLSWGVLRCVFSGAASYSEPTLGGEGGRGGKWITSWGGFLFFFSF